MMKEEDEIAEFFKEALELKNVSLPKTFVNALKCYSHKIYGDKIS